MTRFIYLTDTHFGANPIGYHQQPAYPEKMDALLILLEKEVEKHSIDFIVHGGDLVDTCKTDIIEKAYHSFALSVPVYLCLGNHDLDRKNALDIWLEKAPGLFMDNGPNFEIVSDTVVVHVAPNHWEEGYEYYWKGEQSPYLTDNQLKRIEENILKHQNKVHILVTHSSVFGMEPEQSGLTEITHESPRSFQKQITDLTDKHSNLKLVLSGHNHLNTLKETSRSAFITASSFVETPFEYKIIDVTESCISVSTHKIDVKELEGFDAKYDEGHCFVQGREVDRSVVLKV